MADFGEMTKSFNVQVLDARQANDARAAEVIEAHSTLATALLVQAPARARAMLEAHPEWSIPAPKAGAEATVYKYYAEVGVFAALGFSVFVMKAYDWNNHKSYDGKFVGYGGGLGCSIGWTAGTFASSYTLDLMIRDKWEARFTLTSDLVAVGCTFHGMHGEYIGAYAGGGVSACVGFFAGQGKFEY